MTNKKEIYFLKYGLGGGFGYEYSTYEAFSKEDANNEAYYLAKDEYDSHAGNGIRDLEDIYEEENCETYDEANEIYDEERENWIDYSATLYIPEKHDDYL